MQVSTERFESVISSVRETAESAGVFGEITIDAGMLVCHAKDAAEPAQYRLRPDKDGLWVELVTDNRWLSESIESDLMHTGDKIEELIDEELVELGCDEGPLDVQHFRSEDMLFTFRSLTPIKGGSAEPDAKTVALCLLAYEACFRQLGDMEESDED